MNENEELFEDDELMEKVSKPPEFPPATREQIEQSWKAIASHIEAHAPARGSLAGAHRGGLRAWWMSMFPAAPAWSFRMAEMAALLVIGFGAAWIAASAGWLPGTTTPEVATVVTPKGGISPDRAWMAANDYGSRLEALLLGVAKGDADEEIAPAAREVSRKLLEDNRIYERIARSNNDEVLAQLLSRVETILLVLATAPEGQEQDVINTLREYIDGSDMLGELRAVQSTVPQVPRLRAASGS
ncbi:MAG: hypothetical protein PVJ51_04085 [Acidobacteriota bacterium]